ncbi:Phosphoadenosine phosphosulfate reductase [Anatilimnocola aggregata]|uniref:Adenosine 5'-phosphosulfate reductase n=2 Tax=Anatilimnocola aggregata TaxID=2528021 RepID=A0A517YEN2_9BACT|nr:Phosphoadenosine phosphosulfate reductase [Anatilimnocola aggregata]
MVGENRLLTLLTNIRIIAPQPRLETRAPGTTYMSLALSRSSLSTMSLTSTKPSLRVLNPPAETAEGKLAYSSELQAELDAASQQLESSSPEEILRWAVEHYAPKFTMATAFGPEGMVLIHMLAEIAPETPIFNLDTGYQFKETLELREEIKRRYGIEVELKKPELTVEQFEQANGGPVYRTDPDRCCFERKIKVLQQSALGMYAWSSAIRRDQSPDRAKAPIVGWDKKFGLVKISPLANWTKKLVWNFITQHNVPYNPLHDSGYTSIGCWPCTRAVGIGEDERAGRWSGLAKTECGLHTQ